MSRVLLIRHLPRELSLEEKRKLLSNFGAERVWQLRSRNDVLRNHVVLASFATHEIARTSLVRLHQLEIGKRRLVVEYSEQNAPQQSKEASQETKIAEENLQTFLRELNSWSSSVDFTQPPPPHLRYKYPDPTPKTLLNMAYTMANNTALYTQVLHLMNKMSLDTPFEQNEKAIKYFRILYAFEVPNGNIAVQESASELESEISSEDDKIPEKLSVSKITKRKHLLPRTRKRAVAILPTASALQQKKKKIDEKDIFEEVHLVQSKSICVKLSQDVLTRHQESSIEEVGEIKKQCVKPAPKNCKAETASALSDTSATISRKDILKNKISLNDMKILPVFKNYDPGEPSMRLYLKNLAKTVTLEDVKRLYQVYIEDLDHLDQLGFDVRVMQEGRMKGQGFVTFPSVDIAKVALSETNGYLLNDKVMVVQFARASNKKMTN